MPVVITIIGLYLLIVALRGKHKEAAALLVQDFTGPNSFIPWIVALLFIFALGMIEPLAPVAKAFMVLVIVVLFLKRGTGFFDQLNQQVGIF